MPSKKKLKKIVKFDDNIIDRQNRIEGAFCQIIRRTRAKHADGLGKQGILETLPFKKHLNGPVKD